MFVWKTINVLIISIKAYQQNLANALIDNRHAVAFDPGFIPKSGKYTPGIGYFWSGCAGMALRGIEIPGLSVIDADTRFSFYLDAVQTPPTNCLQDNDLSLIDWYECYQDFFDCLPLTQTQSKIVNRSINYCISDLWLLNYWRFFERTVVIDHVKFIIFIFILLTKL